MSADFALSEIKPFKTLSKVSDMVTEKVVYCNAYYSGLLIDTAPLFS